ncbi:hypothetical protein B0T22DRAFT_456643 [Podospora appendiculata]|uniref:Uncharacterized protein n=1 Tax=Podospora appendiculata TaxID=314037 RepID=A0AAE0WXT3_9PEZI|nr:hypothetical protein B0T22DRAFT_474797 [Podospora appendiculata]KAK3687199.1 hypothetical protein B0T22DRAFT_456643 [Podospora appendiculata]
MLANNGANSQPLVATGDTVGGADSLETGTLPSTNDGGHEPPGSRSTAVTSSSGTTIHNTLHFNDARSSERAPQNLHIPYGHTPGPHQTIYRSSPGGSDIEGRGTGIGVDLEAPSGVACERPNSMASAENTLAKLCAAAGKAAYVFADSNSGSQALSGPDDEAGRTVQALPNGRAHALCRQQNKLRRCFLRPTLAGEPRHNNGKMS